MGEVMGFREAVTVVRDHLKNDGDIYEAFRASIMSVLAEPWNAVDKIGAEALSGKVLDRIIGEERHV